MSFWAGVVQGVKDVDVLKEKEALADERQGVRDQENAYRARMAGIQQTQWAATNARLEEQWAFEKVGMGQSVRDAANGLGIGGSPAGGGGDGGSVPSPGEIEDNTRLLNNWIETSLADETNSQDDRDYLTNLSESFADMKDSNEFWGILKEINDTTGSFPTTSQLRDTVSVTQIPGYADNKAKAVELVATINNMDMSTPEGLAQATTLYDQLKKIDLNAATIDANLSGYIDIKDRPELFKNQGVLFEQGIKDILNEDRLAELETATPSAYSMIMQRHKNTYGAQVLSGLVKDYPLDFRGYDENSMLTKYIDKTPSGVPPTGTDEDAASQAQLAEEEERAAALVADPNNPVVLEQALEALGRDEVERLLYPTRFTPSTSATPGELSGGPFTIDVEPLELPEGTLPSVEGLTGDDAGLLRRVGDVVYELQVSPFGVEWVKPTAPSGPVPDYYEGYARMGEEMGADAVVENAALNPPVNVESEAPTEPVAVEVIPAGQDLTPDQSAELKVGVEELIAAIFANEGSAETITRGLNARFTQERVTEALLGVMGSNQ